MAAPPDLPILQFGTSRFLQAHVDLFVSEAGATGEALGGITVVQTTSSPASSARLHALARPEGFEVHVRGLVGGRRVDERRTCRSVGAALDARTQWPLVRAQMRGPVRVVVSNTGDAGWTVEAADGPALLADDAGPPRAFPAKLLVLLHDRWRSAPTEPLTLLPCELVSRNGERLRELVGAMARAWSCTPDFIDWMGRHPVWANSLVDRIVSEPLEPAGAVAEPYALWAVERQPGLVLPCEHPAIVTTDALQRFERLKLFLLNLGHTLLAELWRRESLGSDMTVLEAMHHAPSRRCLEDAWHDEVLPVFDALGQGDEARAYLVGLRDRLLNPFLRHRLADIAQNHRQKVSRRIAPLLALSAELLPSLPQPTLSAIAIDP